MSMSRSLFQVTLIDITPTTPTTINTPTIHHTHTHKPTHKRTQKRDIQPRVALNRFPDIRGVSVFYLLWCMSWLRVPVNNFCEWVFKSMFINMNMFQARCACVYHAVRINFWAALHAAGLCFPNSSLSKKIICSCSPFLQFLRWNLQTEIFILYRLDLSINSPLIIYLHWSGLLLLKIFLWLLPMGAKHLLMFIYMSSCGPSKSGGWGSSSRHICEHVPASVDPIKLIALWLTQLCFSNMKILGTQVYS